MTTQKHEILAIGHCCVDLIYNVADFLAGEGKTETASFEMQPGGPAANTTITSEKFAQSYMPNALPGQAIRRLHAGGTKTAIITLGAQGSIGYKGENIYRIPAVKVNVVDTTSAGDAYPGADCFAFLQDWPLPEKMKFATFVAAEKCKHLGGRRGLPYRANLKNEFVFK